LLIHFNKFGIPSVLTASERVIPTYFEQILIPLPDLGSRKEFGLQWPELIKIIFFKSDFGLIFCSPFMTVSATKKSVSVTLRAFAQGIILTKCANIHCAGVD